MIINIMKSINLFFLLIIFISCSSGSSEDGSNPIDSPTEIIPSNLNFTATVVGLNSSNPNGDGSGIVKFTATAINAISYSF